MVLVCKDERVETVCVVVVGVGAAGGVESGADADAGVGFETGVAVGVVQVDVDVGAGDVAGMKTLDSLDCNVVPTWDPSLYAADHPCILAEGDSFHSSTPPPCDDRHWPMPRSRLEIVEIPDERLDRGTIVNVEEDKTRWLAEACLTMPLPLAPVVVGHYRTFDPARGGSMNEERVVGMVKMQRRWMVCVNEAVEQQGTGIDHSVMQRRRGASNVIWEEGVGPTKPTCPWMDG